MRFSFILLATISATQANIFSGVFTTLASFNPFISLDENLDERKSGSDGSRLKQSGRQKRKFGKWMKKKPHRKTIFPYHTEPSMDLETSMWRQLDKIEDEMLFNEIIDEPFYDEIFGMPFDYDYEEPEVGREFLSDLKSYEAVPGDNQLKESKRKHKKENQDQSGNNNQTDLLKKMDPFEQIVKQEQTNMQEQANLVEEQFNLEGQANLHSLTNLKKQTDQTAQQQFDQPQTTDAKNIMMSPPQPFISWGRQHLPNWEFSSNPSPPASPFTLPSTDPPTLRNIFGSSPTKEPNPESEMDGVWATTSVPKRRSDRDYLRPKRNEAWERKDGFNPPQISYYFTLDDAIDRDAPLRRRVDHFSSSLEVGETRIEPAAAEMNEISSEDNLVTLSTSRKRVEQKKKIVKRRRLGHIGREMRRGRGFQSEKRSRKKPPRPAGPPPHMIKKLK